nr:4-hydroxyphenylacetate 3-monooxygenase coupling protein [Salmonella sp. NCTC 7297]
MQVDEQRLRFRDAMASLAAAVNIVTTAGHAGRCGITATAGMLRYRYAALRDGMY